VTTGPDARLPHTRQSGVLTFRLILLAAGVAVAFAGIGTIRAGANGDSAWILYAAGRMLEGERLYADLVEMNPPLVFWLHVPIVRTARLLDVSAWGVLVGSVLGAVWLAGALLGGALVPHPADRRRIWTMAAFVLTAIVLPVGWFAQREHLLLVLVWPLLGVTITRLDGRHVPMTIAVAAGTLAGVGLALKPPALVLWPLVAAIVMFRSRSARALLLPEHGAVAIVLVGYALATHALAPDFLPLMRSLAPLYLEFAPQPLSARLFGGFQAWTIWAALLCWVCGGRKALGQPYEAVLASAAASLLLAAVVQGKGFGYHYYPAFACAVALLVLVAVDRGAYRRMAAGTVLVALAVLFAPVIAARAMGQPQRRDTERLNVARRVADAVPPGGALMVLSPRLGDAFPLVNQTGTTLALRFPHLWWLAALERLRREEGEAAHALYASLEAELRRSVAADLSAHLPLLIISRNPAPTERYAGDAPIDPVRSLLTEPEFAAVMSRYQPAGRIAGFDLYVLTPSTP
jgi:hypothetical protein